MAMLFIPENSADWLNWPVEDVLAWRVIGAATMAFAASSLLAYSRSLYAEVRLIIQMEMIWTALAALTYLWGQFFADKPDIGWLWVIIMGAFAVAFSYYGVTE
jgi:uncharacterized membrane protein HdeD (DUF308 family)